MNVFVTGGAGYMGSVLVPVLGEGGHRVCVLDRFCDGGTMSSNGVTARQGDVFQVRADWLDGFDAVIHLAAHSGDAAVEADPEQGWRNNVGASAHLIEACIAAGVPRFILASTCSVYGHHPNAIADEATVPQPAGRYAESKYAVELALEQARSAAFHPFIFRKPTLNGWSPRMRTDVVVNSMLKSALLTGEIVVHNPDVWRPVLHLRDAAAAYLLALAAPVEDAGVYNVHFANYRLIEIAAEVRSALLARGRAAEIKIEHRDQPRNYRVHSEKIRSRLHLRPAWGIGDSVHEMLDHAPEASRWSSMHHLAETSSTR